MAGKQIRAELKIPSGFVSDKDIYKFRRLVKKNSAGIGQRYFNPGSGLVQYGQGQQKKKARRGGRKKGRRRRNSRYKKEKQKHREKQMARHKRKGGHSQIEI